MNGLKAEMPVNRWTKLSPFNAKSGKKEKKKGQTEKKRKKRRYLMPSGHNLLKKIMNKARTHITQKAWERERERDSASTSSSNSSSWLSFVLCGLAFDT